MRERLGIRRVPLKDVLSNLRVRGGLQTVSASQPIERGYEMKMLSYEDLKDRGIRFHPASLSRMVRQGRFPRPVKLSGVPGGRKSWAEQVIDEWLARRLEESQAA
jgi:hypothetical protein